MKEINLASVDLNLLVVFDAVMTERSVSLAARRLNLTQPAVSHALGRLRALLKDHLFVRTQSGMQPTALAQGIAGQVSSVLSDIKGLLAPAEAFEAALSTRRFAIGMTDYAAFVIMPALAHRLEKMAPYVELVVHAASRVTGRGMIERDEVELFVGGIFPERASHLSTSVLFAGRTLCAARKDHPAFARELTAEAYLAFPHLHVSPWGEPGQIDDMLHRRGVSRQITLTISHFLLAPAILQQTNLIATLPELAVRPLAERFGLAVRASPFDFGETEIFLAWHSRLDNDSGLAWLREQITIVAKALSNKAL